MPFGGIDRPALGLSLLKAALARDSIPSDIAYFNLDFCELVGIPFYSAISCNELNKECIPYSALAGDWIFSQYFYGPGSLDARAYVEDILRSPGCWMSDDNIRRLLSLRAIVSGFLKSCFRKITWSRYSVVGFTTTFEQNMASLCLARLVKTRFPEIMITFGGANCEGEMGKEMLRRFPFIDFVSLGEADNSFPSLLRLLRSGCKSPSVPGIAARRGIRHVSKGRPEIVLDIDGLPYPNFDDYFSRLAASPLKHQIVPLLPLETARGCWWGEKHQCTFCGLNGSGIRFRSKSADRAVNEILYFVDRFALPQVTFADNIMDLKYFDTVLPRLRRERSNLQLFYETKSNLNKSQICRLGEYGVKAVQPGIESFSTNILKLMGKGVSGLQNVAFLKWSHQYGVLACWNLLYGFPGENPADYGLILDILKRITHLNPPDAVGGIRLDRFSKNFAKPGEHGFTNIRPLAPYRYVYRFKEPVLMNLAYFFSFKYRDGRRPLDYLKPIMEFWYEWKMQKNPGQLQHVRRNNGEASLIDSRFNRVLSKVELDVYQNAAYEFCDNPRSILGVRTFLEVRFPKRNFKVAAIDKFLNYMVQTHLMVREGEAFLSVAPVENGHQDIEVMI